jgi:hypothetical protein
MIPVELNLVQLEIDRGDCLGLFPCRSLDLPENFTLGAQQDHAPASAHTLGDGRSVLRSATAVAYTPIRNTGGASRIVKPDIGGSRVGSFLTALLPSQLASLGKAFL